jgi:hypothetical protein
VVVSKVVFPLRRRVFWNWKNFPLQGKGFFYLANPRLKPKSIFEWERGFYEKLCKGNCNRLNVAHSFSTKNFGFNFRSR